MIINVSVGGHAYDFGAVFMLSARPLQSLRQPLHAGGLCADIQCLQNGCARWIGTEGRRREGTLQQWISLPPTHTHHHARAHAVHAEGAHSQADTWLHSPEEVLECGLGTVLNFFADCRMLSTNQFLATQIFCR